MTFRTAVHRTANVVCLQSFKLKTGVVFRKVRLATHDLCWRDDALPEFIKKHEKNIIGCLNGWDRIRFRETIPLYFLDPHQTPDEPELDQNVRQTGFGPAH
jgi:hypothetical protein